MPSKTPISKARTYQEIGAFWDEHDATEYGEKTEDYLNARANRANRVDFTRLLDKVPSRKPLPGDE